MNARDDSTSIVLEYINCINAGDSEKLAAMQTEDFTFIDMGGDKFVGRDGWELVGIIPFTENQGRLSRVHLILKKGR